MKLKIRRPSHGTVVAYAALFLALGGVGYAALKLPANSVGTKQIKQNAVTLTKIAPSTRTALKGATGAPCLATNPACRGPQGPSGPGAITIHVDTKVPFNDMTFGTLGPWTIHASCTDNGTTAKMTVTAVGPTDSIADGLEINNVPNTYPYSNSGGVAAMHVGNDFSFPTTGSNVEIDNLDLYSSKGGAHISIYKYETGAGSGSGFRCKISGTAYPTS